MAKPTLQQVMQIRTKSDYPPQLFFLEDKVIWFTQKICIIDDPKLKEYFGESKLSKLREKNDFYTMNVENEEIKILNKNEDNFQRLNLGELYAEFTRLKIKDTRELFEIGDFQLENSDKVERVFYLSNPDDSFEPILCLSPLALEYVRDLGGLTKSAGRTNLRYEWCNTVSFFEDEKLRAIITGYHRQFEHFSNSKELINKVRSMPK